MTVTVAVAGRDAVPGERAPSTWGRAVRRVGRSLLSATVTVVVTALVWQGAIWALHLSPYFAKGPADVFDYLFSGPQASADRQLIFSNLGTTLFDALLGYLAGTGAALVLAMAIVTSRPVEQTVMPVAIALRAVPLVAMTPVLELFTGQGLLTVTIIAGVVCFFPSLVNLVFGLRSAPTAAFDLMRAYGADEVAILRKVQVPYALAALFASAKIAVPGAIVGATLAEWLATGDGLGYQMFVSSSDSGWSELWTAVTVITVTSVVLYNILAMVEKPVIARYRGNV